MAHRGGIIHRALKPSNFMVTSEDRIKILDFGLARLLDTVASRTDDTTVAAPLTEERAEGQTLEALRHLQLRRRSLRNDHRSAALCRRP